MFKMKKIILISLLLVGLFLISCSEEEFETDVGEFLDSVFYDKKELVVDDVGGTQATGHFESHVGVIESSWIKDHSKANTLKTLDWWEYDELLKEK